MCKGNPRVLLQYLGLTAIALVVATTTGCASRSAGSDYYKAKSTRDLEFPPGLSAPQEDRSMAIPEQKTVGTTTLSAFAGGDCKGKADREVLPSQDGVDIKRDNYHVWMQVTGTPTQIWPWVRDFWSGKGFEIEQDTPRLGIMVTNWFEYSEVQDGPKKKDRYRTRLESASDASKTEIHLTLQQLTAVKEKGLTRWVGGEADAEQEIEMIKRLAVYLGANSTAINQAKVENIPGQTEVIRDSQGYVRLLIRGNGDSTLQNFRDGLDRINAKVKQIDGDKLRYQITIEGTDKAPPKPQQAWMESILQPSGKTTQVFFVDIDTRPDHILITPTDKFGRPLSDSSSEAAISELMKAK